MAGSQLESKVRFTKHAEFSDNFKQRIFHVLQFYPMLQYREITISICRRANLLGSAYEWTTPQRLYLKPNVSQMVIAHELTHLIQGTRQGFGIPHGEQACDIWTVVRMPEHEIDDLPYYIIPPRLHSRLRQDWDFHRRHVKEACKMALSKREKVPKSQYIKFFEKWVIDYAKAQAL